jgi:3',5'-cyclic AMP phosphodiesterase CpdA
MIIAQISDTHIALDTPDADCRRGDFERTVADINALDPQPDVVVHTGDIVHNGRADEYTVAASILAGLRAPVYVIPGNKDDRTNLRAAFAGTYLAPGSDFIDYVAEDFPLRLIALDTLDPAGNKGDFSPERIGKLTRWLDAETAKPAAVFCHHPPFSVPVGPVAINYARPEIMAELAAVLQRPGQVAGIFCGHVHRAFKGHAGKIPAVVMPSIATTLRYGDYPPELKACPLYYIHRFDGRGEFTTEARIVGQEALRKQAL